MAAWLKNINLTTIHKVVSKLTSRCPFRLFTEYACQLFYSIFQNNILFGTFQIGWQNDKYNFLLRFSSQNMSDCTLLMTYLFLFFYFLQQTKFVSFRSYLIFALVNQTCKTKICHLQFYQLFFLETLFKKKMLIKTLF